MIFAKSIVVVHFYLCVQHVPFFKIGDENISIAAMVTIGSMHCKFQFDNKVNYMLDIYIFIYLFFLFQIYLYRV